MAGDFQDSMMEIFVLETNKFLASLEEILIATEESEDSIIKATPEIFRIMHTIKSSSAMMSLDNISRMAHKVEDLFFYIRENNPQNIDGPKLTDIVLAGVDFIKRNMEPGACEAPDEITGRVESFLNEIKGGGAPKKEEPAVLNEARFSLKVIFKADCPMLGLRAFEIFNKVKAMSKELTSVPSDAADDEQAIKKDGLLLFIKSEKESGEIKEAILKSPFVESVADYQQEEKEPEAKKEIHLEEVPAESAPIVERRRDASRTADTYANVEIAKLDYLVDIVGEILVSQMELARNIERRDFDKSEASAERMKRLILTMQEAALTTRMIPLRETFHKMNRVVRDMCRKQDKDIAFVTVGEGTEVDRGIVENISSPLMHIIRNSVDHGIEAAGERAAAAKPEKGRIELAAYTEGRNVVITVSDDGKGFDTEKILEKALASGQVTREQAAKMKQEDINALVFLPGFSTKKEVTEFSGRGVGMDVVSENMKTLGGKVTAYSKKGEGTKIVLKIPLTLAIIDTVVIRVGEETCAVPVSSVSELFGVGSNESIRNVNGRDMLLLRDECYTIVNLFDFYSYTDKPAYEDGMMIVVKSDTGKYVLFANEVVDRQDVVVKSVPPLFKSIKGVSGCTILGDGKISLILDIGELESIFGRKD